MSSPNAQDADSAAQIEQLLAKSIGPMAKIVLARARKKPGDDAAILQAIAKHIQDDAERDTFLTAAARILKAQHRPGGTSNALALVSDSAPPDTSNAAPPSAAAPVRAPAIPTEMRAAPKPPAADDGVMKPGAIFVSYARDNLAVAQRLADALRGAGLDVWLDLGKLQAGDAWDLKIRRNIEACSFFMALISRETDARREGYFRREWNIAADRALNFADDVPFLLPVTVDDTAAYNARVPERFRSAHWTALPGGEMSAEFLDRLTELVDDYRRRHAPA